MSDTLRFATIGTGDITGLFAAAIAEVPGVALHGVQSRDRARAASLAAEWGAVRSYGTVEECLADDEVDAVYIASPNTLHAEQARAALRAGRHVLLEKPATPTAAEWDDLVAESRRAGRVLLEAMRTAYDPGLVAVADLLPRLGVLRWASFRYVNRSSRYSKVLAGEPVNIFDPAMAGGALRDLGVYSIHAMVRLFGEPVEVSGASTTIATGADGNGAAIATYPGMVAEVSWSKITRTRQVSEIAGEDATLTIDHIASPRELVLTTAEGEQVIRVDGPSQHSLAPEIAFFARAVSGAEDVSDDHAATATTLRIVDALRS